MEEVSDFKEEILANAGEVIKSIFLYVYPSIDGYDKQRLSFIYDLLSDCYKQLEESEVLPIEIDQHIVQRSALELARFCKIVGQECSKVSFIEGLNFKNIALLEDLNLTYFNNEVCAQIDENNVEALAKMVQSLVLMYGDTAPNDLISWKYVYTHYVMGSLVVLEGKAERDAPFQSSAGIYSYIDEIEQMYNTCKKHIKFVEYPGVLDILRRFFTIILRINKNLSYFPCDTTGKDCLVKLINFWLRLMNDIEELDILAERFYSKCSDTCLKVFLDLLVEGIVSPTQGWCTVVNYVTYGFKCTVAAETLNFCQALIFSGCGFESVARVFSVILEKFPPESLLITNDVETSVNIQDLSKLYLSILETIIQEITSGSHERQRLHYLLSSLSKLEGDLEDLKKVRLAVWDRMSMFCDNLQLPGNLRVYSLELMQFISGRKRNSDFFSSEWGMRLLPWEGWDDFQDRTANREDVSDDPTKDGSSRFTSTLVALKSSHLVSSISPGLEITPEDIISVDSAVSCFLRISELVTDASHVGALLAILAEWEGLFTTETNEVDDSPDASDAMNSWSNDDWDEGWESFQEETVEKETKKSNSISIHPLHTCWMTVITKMISLSNQRDVLKLLDQNVAKYCGILLNEDDACKLTQTTVEVDCFLALKIALFLPYEAIQSQCLDAVENNLKEQGVPDNRVDNFFFAVLVLSSGILSDIITKASYGTMFSYLCFVVGNLCHQSQEARISTAARVGQSQGAQVSTDARVGPAGEEENRENLVFLFVKLLFPCFVVELVKADQHVLAGFLVTRFMHTDTSLSLINVAEASLRQYLERRFMELQESESWENTSLCEPLMNTITDLRKRLLNSIQSALALLPTDVR